MAVLIFLLQVTFSSKQGVTWVLPFHAGKINEQAVAILYATMHETSAQKIT